MPWTIEDPPSPPVGEDWQKDEIQACVSAANAVLEDGGDEGEAIQACIAAAGRSAKTSDPPEVAKEASFDAQIQIVRDAWHQEANQPVPAPAMAFDSWVIEVFPDRAIIEIGSELWEYPYTTDEAGQITFGEPTKVEKMPPEYKPAKAMMAWGPEPIKALGEGKVGAYGIKFGSPDQKDLHTEYFDSGTDYGPHAGNGMAATVHHRIPVGKKPELRALAKRVLTNPVRATADAVGLFVEHILDMADEYEAAIYRLAEAGKLKWSSGTASHMAETEQDGRVSLWHVIEWAYTPQPAEPRLPAIMPLRALADLTYPAEPATESPGSKPGDGAGLGAGSQADAIGQSTNTRTGEKIMSEDTPKGQGDFVSLSPEQIQEIVGKVSSEVGAVISPQVAEQILKSLAVPPKGEKPKGKATHKLADAAGTEGFADFLISVLDRDTERLKSVYGSEKVDMGKSRRKDLVGGSGGAGGYIIPPQFIPDLLSVDPIAAVVRPRAHIQPMASDTLTMPRLNVTAQPTSGNTYHFGGVMAYWTEEAVATSETEPGFEQFQLTAHKMGGHTQVSEELYDDEGIGLSALLKRLFGGAITWVEDWSFLRGSGSGQPLGILNADAIKTVQRATASEFALADAANMLGGFMPSSFGRGVWVMNITVLPQLVQLDDGTNVVWIPNAREGIPITLFGMPVLFTDKTPALGTEGDVILADWSYYVLGDRQKLAIAASEHFAFTSGLITIRFTHRIDGQPWLDGPVYIDDTNTISPFVVLTDAA